MKTISQRSSFDKGNKTLIWVVFATELTGCLHSSLFSTVTVPPELEPEPENELYVCRHFRCFNLLGTNRIVPIPPRCRRQPLAQMTWLSSGQSPAVRLSHRRSCDSLLVHPCKLCLSLEIGVCLQNSQIFQATPLSQNCTNSPSVSPKAVGANNVAEAWMPKQRQSNQG